MAKKKSAKPKRTRSRTAPKSQAQFTVGIDLGGTKIAAGLVNAEGRLLKEIKKATVLATETAPTPKQHIQHVVKTMAEAVGELVDLIPGSTRKQRLSALRGVGLASAGPMNVLQGKLIHPSNFKGWEIVPLVAFLEKALAKHEIPARVSFQNDAIAAALGEGWKGAARGCGTYAVVTLGTGIGSGVIFHGRPAQSGGMGSEWGHMIADVSPISDTAADFYHSTVEGLASGTGMFRRAKTLGFHGDSMADLAAAAREGSALAKSVFADASRALAAMFFNLCVGFHLERIVVTGGLIHVQDLFVPQAIESYQNLVRQDFKAFECEVKIAKLGTAAGVIGAARLPWLEA